MFFGKCKYIKYYYYKSNNIVKFFRKYWCEYERVYSGFDKNFIIYKYMFY